MAVTNIEINRYISDEDHSKLNALLQDRLQELRKHQTQQEPVKVPVVLKPYYMEI